MKEQMNIVIAGHVDHGKSTIIGRLMADTNSLPEGKLEQVKLMCEKNSKPFEYAFLLDALKDERSQGITIDSARVFFKTTKRNYIIIDAPGHIEFLKNMVSGAARAEAALLVIDAEEGVKENSRRHGYMLSMLGIKQVAVLINKMDLVNYEQDIFNKISEEYTRFLKEIDIEPSCFIPISGRNGDNIASINGVMKWYHGSSLLDVLDHFQKEKPPLHQPFRMSVQDVYKFTLMGDSRRIVAGTIESGAIKVGDEVVFYPSGKKSKVQTIESFNTSPQKECLVGEAVGFTLAEQIYIKRGEMASLSNESKPSVATRIRVNLFWLGNDPFVMNKGYYLKLGSTKVGVKLEKVNRIINASDLSVTDASEQINRHDVAECVLVLSKAIAFDSTEKISTTSRFVIVDDYEIAGGGIIRNELEDELTWVRDKVILRNYKWEKSKISSDERAEKYNQKSAMIIITGPKDSPKKEIAKMLESSLFGSGKFVYFLGIGNVLYGLDSDIKNNKNANQAEHLRRLAEVAHILLESGIILIVTAVELREKDISIIKTSVNSDKTFTAWIGDELTTDIKFDIRVSDKSSVEESVNKLKSFLYKKEVIVKL